MIQLASVPSLGPAGPAPAALKIASGVSDFALALSSLALPGKLVAPAAGEAGEPAELLLPERQPLAADGKELPDAPGLFAADDESDADPDEDAPEAPPAPLMWLAPAAPEAPPVAEAAGAAGSSPPDAEPGVRAPAVAETPSEPAQPVAAAPATAPVSTPNAELRQPTTLVEAPATPAAPDSVAPEVPRARKHKPAVSAPALRLAPLPLDSASAPASTAPAQPQAQPAAAQPRASAAPAKTAMAVEAATPPASRASIQAPATPPLPAGAPQSAPALVPASAPAVVEQAVAATPAATASPAGTPAPGKPDAAAAPAASEPISPVDPRQLAAAPVIRIDPPRHWAQRAEPTVAAPLAPVIPTAPAATASIAAAEPALPRFAAPRDSAPEPAPLAQPAAVAAPVVAASADTQQAPLDMRRHEWPGQMIERIEALRDAAPLRETRISLMPEALGRVDISIRQDGDRVHVHFATETQAARQMIAEAQPRLGEIAESRGLKLGQTSVETGGAGAQPGSGQRHDAPPRSHSQPSAPPGARAGARSNPDTDDERIA